MHVEPANKFWIAPNREELAAENARLKSILMAAVIVAVIGWALFAWRVFQ